MRSWLEQVEFIRVPGEVPTSLRQLTGLRAEYFNIGDYAAGRMPLAYPHFVRGRAPPLRLCH